MYGADSRQKLQEQNTRQPFRKGTRATWCLPLVYSTKM